MAISRARLVAAALAALAALAGPPAAAEPVGYLDQGWSADLRDRFYYTPQGSHLIRADWFAVLEQPDGPGRLGDPAYLARFGFIPPEGPSDRNPQGYPIGFALETGTDQIGLTCAACHTANVEVDGEVLRIDGAPARLDLDAFYQALARAVTLTRADPARFQRFAAALGVTDDEGVARLRTDLTAFDRQLTADAVLRRPAVASGFGRVDALTQIINALAVRDQGHPGNLFPVAAPTSYPALWLTPELEFVQWNPIAASPIARNGGQVLGVYGQTALAADAGQGAFASTMRLTELAAIEDWLQDLAPPAWDPARMGEIDAGLAAQGQALFAQHCAACHNMAPYARTDPAANAFGRTFIRIGRVDYRAVGTDPTYVTSLLGRTIAANPVTAPLFDGADAVPAALFFTGTVGAAVRRAIGAAGLTQEQAVALNGYRFHRGPDGQLVPDQPPRLTDLKAGPLAAVWATGPYLHNGSVPTVYELLSPPEDRRAVFWTGGRALDLERLGFESSDAPGRFRFDTTLPGNGNGGHRFPPAGLTPAERRAVIEYLKTQ